MNTKMIIAEIGSVHDGSFGNATFLIRAAAAAGANVVKFQTHIAEAETLRDAPMPPYFKGEPRYEYFQRTSFTPEQWAGLRAECTSCGVQFLSSPFSLEAVDLLESVGIDMYKIPSGEITNLPLLHKVAATGKPILLSSGMSDWSELDKAVETVQTGGPLVVMQCTSEYPTPPERVGLNVLSEIHQRYSCTLGFSDHTIGYAAPFAAAALGAQVIEKHFAFSRLMYGSDAKTSMEPDEFKVLSQGLHDIWKMLESPVDKNSVESLREMKMIFEKSIVASRALKEGQIIELADLAFKKPGTGIPAAHWEQVIGKTLAHNVEQDTQLHYKDLK
ncbi:N-acetylneuraminate synthase [Alkalispirochaeta americana]|uniref:N-acetylneuraminate synthase n=1 Tax=Alkalispirochaeta americana TaxID=159291 RepID=A0A1N6XSL4_9SPIO|nr:N-acetylneuraminate synthase family protein [Alkalispirochaeta americana]SIR05181.1 N-acetylneuraminate synthase [Alkalispirochaeta americana]